MVLPICHHLLLICIVSLVTDTLSFPSGGKAIQYRRLGSQPVQKQLVLDGDRKDLTRRQQDDLSSQTSQLHSPVQIPGQQTQNHTDASGANTTTIEAGVIPPDNTTLPQTDCRTLRSGLDNKCWEELQLSTWITNWVATHSCYSNEPFSRCFLRTEGWPMLDCTGLKLVACVPPQIDLQGVTAEAYYVAWNIFGMPCFEFILDLS